MLAEIGIVAMRCSSDRNDLRIALDFPDNTDANQHRRLVEEVSQTYPHAIKFVSEPGDYTCGVYSFDLNNSDVYRAIAIEFNREVFAGKKFIEWMLRGHLNEVDHPALGSLACYFSASDWTHVGVVTGINRITSKWGTYPIYEHEIWEVPARYGDLVRFFGKPPAETALEYFLDYARYEGVLDKDINDIVAEVRTRSA